MGVSFGQAVRVTKRWLSSLVEIPATILYAELVEVLNAELSLLPPISASTKMNSYLHQRLKQWL